LNGFTTAYRLREGIVRFFVTDINSSGASAESSTRLPTMWESVMDRAIHFNHLPAGQNVLYLYDHVEFSRYDDASGEFPANGAEINFHHGMHRHAGHHEDEHNL
jgi:hypothetical protein